MNLIYFNIYYILNVIIVIQYPKVGNITALKLNNLWPPKINSSLEKSKFKYENFER